MQILSVDNPRARVGFLVPRWTAKGVTYRQGLPFRSVPVVGALLHAGYEVVFFDQETDLDLADRCGELRAALATAIATFVWMGELEPMIQSTNALLLTQLVKGWYPERPVAVGGTFIAIVPAEVLYIDSPADYFLRGYGEVACIELIEALRGERALQTVSGLVWRDGGHRHAEVRDGHRMRARDLGAYDRLDLAPFVERGGIFGNDAPTFTVAFMHGCPKACTFCYWRGLEPSMLAPEACVDVLQRMRLRYGVRQFHVADLDFAVNRKRALAFAALMRERLPDCTWFALMSPIDAVRFTDADWDLLAASGLRKIEFGSESGSPRVLAAMGKRHTPEDSLHVTRQALRRGIVPMHNFLFGTPGETAADRHDTLRLIERLRRLERSWLSFTFRFFQPPWNAPLGAAAIATDPDYPDRLDRLLAQRPRFGDPRQHAMKWLSAADERQIKALVYYYLPVTISKHALPQRARQWMYRALRAVAALRLRFRFHRFGVDRWLYERVVRAPLDNTYCP